MTKTSVHSTQLTFRCRESACRAGLREALTAAGPSCMKCLSCGKSHDIRIDDALVSRGELTRCAVCDGSEFFIRKDFPQRLGMTLVVLFGLVASVFFYYKNIPATFVTLASVVVVDAAIYLFVGKVTVCYRCRAEYRGLPPDPRYGGFDLATSEKYDVTA